MKQDKKKQAMTNKFRDLMTNPLDYTPHAYPAHYGVVHNCELCGASLVYSYKLTHNTDKEHKTKKSLLVGSECIVNYATAFAPTLTSMLLAQLEKSKDAARIKMFEENNPDLPMITQEIKKEVDKYVNENKLWSFREIMEIEEVLKHISEYRRKKYLTKSKVIFIKDVYELINYGVYTDLISEYLKENKEFVHRREDKDVEFYKELDRSNMNFWFSKGYNHPQIRERKYSELEKKIVLWKIEKKRIKLEKEKRRRDRRSQKLLQESLKESK